MWDGLLLVFGPQSSTGTPGNLKHLDAGVVVPLLMLAAKLLRDPNFYDKHLMGHGHVHMLEITEVLELFIPLCPHSGPAHRSKL